MKKYFFLLILFSISSVSVNAQMKKVSLIYQQPDEVFVMVNDKLVGTNPNTLKIDFNLGGEIVFFKIGYYSQQISIDPETIFVKLKIDLEKKPKTAKASQKKLLNPDTLLISEIITNMDEHDVREVLDENFIKNNYFIGKDAALFPQAVNEIQNSRYKIGIEVVKTRQASQVYKNPRFMMAYAKIRWTLLDTQTNKIAYFKETEGHYFVKIHTTRGLQVSKQKTKVMKEAMKEAQFKLLTDQEFIDLIKKS